MDRGVRETGVVSSSTHWVGGGGLGVETCVGEWSHGEFRLVGTPSGSRFLSPSAGGLLRHVVVEARSLAPTPLVERLFGSSPEPRESVLLPTSPLGRFMGRRGGGRGGESR